MIICNYIYIHTYIKTMIVYPLSCPLIFYPDLLRRFSGLSEMRQGHFTVVDMGGNIALHNAKYNRLSGQVGAAVERCNKQKW